MNGDMFNIGLIVFIVVSTILVVASILLWNQPKTKKTEEIDEYDESD